MAPRLGNKNTKVRVKHVRKVHVRKAEITGTGHVVHIIKTMTAPQIAVEKARIAAEMQADAEALAALRARLLEFDKTDNYDDGEFDTRNYAAGVLSGAMPLDPSHEGGELRELHANLRWSLWEDRVPGRKRRQRREIRTRHDRTENRNQAFQVQMAEMTDAYMSWEAREHVRGAWHAIHCTNPPNGMRMKVVDSFKSATVKVSTEGGPHVPSALLAIGLVPCAPYNPSLSFTIDTLEFFRVANLHCPRLSIQAYVRTLSELHGTVFLRYLSVQFSIAFDLYLAIRAETTKRVKKALRRNTPDWRLHHTCPACTYKLEDEAPLRMTMLATYDGNDSLKRILRRGEVPDGEDAGPVIERIDTRQFPNDFILPPDVVDKWARVKPGVNVHSDEEPDSSPCAERWHNMSETLTAMANGIYDETGFFLCACRHRFALLACDMIRSGELSKYPLAVTDKLLRTFEAGLGIGYDVNCSLASTIANSSLGDLAKEHRYHCLVGAFHGHAHCRLCQLVYLATYQLGLGMEDLETCERIFSKSNALAGATRHASRFHRQQAIVTYFEHADDQDAYSALSDFLNNNYKQALEILKSGPENLRQAMADLHIPNEDVFEQWLADEKSYLEGLKKEPVVDTLEMQYLERLKKLAQAEEFVQDEVASGFVTDGGAVFTQTAIGVEQAGTDKSRVTETRRRHIIERRDKELDAVQHLETQLAALDKWTVRWTAEMPEWEATERLIAKRGYQRALDNLEGLLVARIFELTKANMSMTGYKLRKHIAKALQTRSKAVRNALNRYNTAAEALSPPRQTLRWEDVVEHAFLADFDILRDTREDVRERPWASNAARLAMTLHFKILRAREEIERVEIEARRLFTHIHDEAKYLQEAEETAAVSNPTLAYHIRENRQRRARFDDYHLRRLEQMNKLVVGGLDFHSGVAVKSYSVEAAEVMETEVDDGAMDNVRALLVAEIIQRGAQTAGGEESSDDEDYGIEGGVDEEEAEDTGGLEEEDDELAEQLLTVLRITGGDEGEE